ncbi:hemagglutinin repeat-containing protein [Pseudomonas akapageensis]|uniref:hemagglutinin repeat-containing protein n=1 Tax=Pseudomonas akapageensis TaxID=2609961 RepID=UPI00140A8D6A|nr:hemagglutinin repeat-containing protein [Pseudomonas akapageensis]
MKPDKNDALRPRPDTLRWVISSILLAPCLPSVADGLQPAAGPGGTPLISQNHGVPVIDIVAPNGQGLSHNQFLDYNVATPGAVLNNALQGGQSALAGVLAANPQFRGQAASVILNEVISRNPSSINGAQEIFGRPADYVLANPNGISVNGASFINTTRAGFLVGTPEIEDGRLKRLNTLNAQGSLQVHEKGLENREGALDLLAPRIDSRGLIVAQGDLNLTAGRNRVNHADGQIVEVAPAASADPRIDASLFGAMQAGRIKIVSTANGAGVRLGAPAVEARQGLQISSAGNLEIGERDASKDRSRLSAGQGDMHLDALGNITLTAVNASGRDINAKAGKDLVLDALTREKLSRSNTEWSKSFWFITTETYSRTVETSDKSQIGTQLDASRHISLQAGNDARLAAARVKAGDTLNLTAGNDLMITAGIDRKVERESIRHRKHLWRGDSDSSSVTESAVPSQLSGRTLNLQSGARTDIRGSSVRSEGDVNIKARTVAIDTISLDESSEKKDYSGDLVSGSFFGNRGENSRIRLNRNGSEVLAKGDLSIISDDVRITGSRVMGEGQSRVISEKGALIIENAQTDFKTNESTHDSKVFGLISQRTSTQARSSTVLSSDIGSETNLRLASAQELRVIGSNITAKEHLAVQAAGDINIIGATDTLSSDTRESSRSFTAQAKQTKDALDGKPDSRQFVASVGYEVREQQTLEDRSTIIGSTLKGGEVKIDSGKNLIVESSTIESTVDDVQIAGESVKLLAGRDRIRSEKTDTRSGGGLALTGGIDRVGSAFEGYQQARHSIDEQSTPVSTLIDSSGKLTITADAGNGHIETEAAKLRAKGPTRIVAGSMDNREASATREQIVEETNWKGNLGASIEYKDLTRPIERLVNGEEETKFQQAAIEDAFLPPSLGADLEINHLNRVSKESTSQAIVSEFSSATLETNIAGHLSDSGTRYEARAGTLRIDAKSHDMKAAHDTSSSELSRLEVDGSFRVFTNTGSDVNARLAATGGSIERTSETSTAVPGSLYGQTGIQVQLGSDGIYEGTRINGGSGPVSIQSGGTLTLAQANDRQSKSENLFDGNGWAKGGNSPAAGKSAGASVLLNKQTSASEDTQARVAEIDSQGPVRLEGSKGTRLEGTRIGSADNKVQGIELSTLDKVEILAAVDTHTAEGQKLGGALQVSASANKTADSSSKGGGIGGHFQAGRTLEQSRTLKGAAFNSQSELAVTAGGTQENAIDLEGLLANATRIKLQTSQGGIRIQDATSTEFRDNLDLMAGVGVNKTVASDASKSTSGLYARAKVDIDKLDSTTHANSRLRADQVTFDSFLDTRLSGVDIDARLIDGKVGGDLLVESRQDQVSGLKVKVDAKLSKENNPQGLLNGVSAFAGPASGKFKEKFGKDIQGLDTDRTATLNAEIEKIDRNTVAQASSLSGRNGIDLKVEGNTLLTGATLKSSNGKVAPGSGKVEMTTLEGFDSRTQVGINGSNSPVDLVTGVMNAYKGTESETDKADRKVDLGVLRTGGHNTRQVLPSSIEHGIN